VSFLDKESLDGNPRTIVEGIDKESLVPKATVAHKLYCQGWSVLF
jgi:hypothetical protein